MDLEACLAFPQKIYTFLSSHYRRLNSNNRFKFFAALVLSFILILRVGVFANKYAGFEHDSGWIMSLAQSVADHGIFASMVDTSNGKAPGILGNIHGRPSVVTEDFHTLFPYAVTVGPGYAIPQAILLKIFGSHFWSLRLWPQISMWILCFLSILFVFTYGGIYSGLLYSIFLYITPRLYVAHSFEAYAETIAVLYSFIGFLIFHHHRVPFMGWIKNWRIGHPLVAGIFLGLGVETKLLALLFAPTFIFSFLLSWMELKSFKKSLAPYLWLLFGFLIPIFTWEFFRFSYLSLKFGVAAFSANNQEWSQVMNTGGAGLKGIEGINWDFAKDKLGFFEHLGLSTHNIIWYYLFVMMAFFLVQEKKDRHVILHLLIFSLGNIIWFIFLSTTGWFRHVILGAWILLYLPFILTERVISFIPQATGKLLGLGFAILSVVILSNNFHQAHSFNSNFWLNQEDLDHWNKIRGGRGLPSTPIFPLKDQEDLVSFFEKNIKENDAVFYEGWLLVAEIPVLVKKIFHSLGNLPNIRSHYTGKAYLIIGSYSKGPYPWRFLGDDYAQKLEATVTSQTVYANPSYTVYLLKE